MCDPEKPDDPIASARFCSEPPVLLGDVGQDDAFATESNPEGLRYGERPHPPGTVEHGAASPETATPNIVISVG